MLSEQSHLQDCRLSPEALAGLVHSKSMPRSKASLEGQALQSADAVPQQGPAFDSYLRGVLKCVTLRPALMPGH